MPINNISQIISTIPEAGRRGIDVQTVFVNKQEDFQDHLQGTTVTELNTLKTQMNTMAGEMNTTASQVNTDATTASTSATTATTKASEASASASQALTSSNQAETFKNSASTSATTASTKASEASASATSASASATTASTKASEASASATTASTKASEASASATTASTSASNASASATTATTKASEASASATSASASASNALASRNQAEIFAQQAQASATSIDVNNIVHRTGDESIAGVKTFSSTIVGSISGNSETATKLATARTIGGVSFDGSANINLPGVNTAGNQNTTGNAATATKLATARTINGVSFDGTANITVVDSTKAPLASPAFTGTPTAPTATAGDNSTKIATTAFVLANSLRDISFTAGTKLEAQATTEVPVVTTTYTKKKEISVSTGGTITVSFRMRALANSSAYAVYGQIYVNGVAVGTVRTNATSTYVTYTENITINAGDLVQLYLKGGTSVNNDSPAYTDQFKIFVGNPSTSTVLLN